MSTLLFGRFLPESQPLALFPGERGGRPPLRHLSLHFTEPAIAVGIATGNIPGAAASACRGWWFLGRERHNSTPIAAATCSTDSATMTVSPRLRASRCHAL